MWDSGVVGSLTLTRAKLVANRSSAQKSTGPRVRRGASLGVRGGWEGSKRSHDTLWNQPDTSVTFLIRMPIVDARNGPRSAAGLLGSTPAADGPAADSGGGEAGDGSNGSIGGIAATWH